MEELFVPFRGVRPNAAEVRSTVIVSAIHAVRTRGLGDAYERAMSAAERGRILTLSPGIWTPIDVAVAHYHVMDRLRLEAATIDSIGAEVGERVYKSVLATVVKLSVQAGVSPWNLLSISHRINDLSWKGTDVAVWKLGPKDARYEWIGQPCAAVPYFVRAFGSFLRTLVNMFSGKAYVQPLPRSSSSNMLVYRVSWA